MLFGPIKPSSKRAVFVNTSDSVPMCCHLYLLEELVCHVCLPMASCLRNTTLASFPAGTMEGAEEKKKKVPAVPETLKKKHRNFAELKIKRLRKKFAQKML